MQKTDEKTINVGCRIPKPLLALIKNIGKPGSIVTSMVNTFFKAKSYEKSLEPGTTISGPDESLILTSHNQNQILLTIKKGDQVIILDYDEKAACHLILKLNALVNLNR